MVAYHFPPLAGSSGIQRTLRFVQHLPKFGWQPLVLTASPHAYERVGTDLDADVPADTVVRRAFALDNARHLAVGGRHLAFLGRPDRWISWRFDAVRQGMQMIRTYRPAVLWSTYPIATAHLIGAELQRRSGLPWVADFRDPMAQEGYPADPQTRAQYRAIEAHSVRSAAWSLFTTPGAAALYSERYPQAAQRIGLLENGYDDESFAAVAPSDGCALEPGTFTLLHSGIVYPSERDPSCLFDALRLLRDDGLLAARPLKLRFRAAVHDEHLKRLAAQRGVQELIETCPPLPYKQALAEMMRADGLLLLQAANCNEQVPAKLYEYLRAGRPLIGLTDASGDTAQVLRASGIADIAALDDAAQIAGLLRRVLVGDTAGTRARPDAVRAASREGRTAELAALLDRLAAAAR